MKKIKIWAIASMVIATYCIKAQSPEKIVLQDIEISLDTIPFDSFIKSKQHESIREVNGHKIITANGYRIDANCNKGYFLLSKYYFDVSELGSDINFDDEVKTSLSLYNHNGDIVWHMKFERSIEKCKISTDGNLVHILRTCAFNCNNDLVSVNRQGKIIYEQKDIVDFISDGNGKAILLLKEFKPNTQVIYKNFFENTELNFHDKNYGLTLAGISGNGNFFSIYKDKEINSYSKHGKLLWSKEMNEFYYGLSYDGNNYLAVDKTSIKLKDNLDNNLVWRRSIETNDGYSFSNVFFISNSSLIACIHSKNNISKIIFLTMNGEIANISNVNVHQENIEKIKYIGNCKYLILKQGQKKLELVINYKE